MKSLKSYFYRAAGWTGVIDKDVALQEQAADGHTDNVRALLDAGADVHADEDEGLRLAAMHGHAKTVEELLKAGADVHAGNDVALHVTEINGHADTVKILKDWMAREVRKPSAPSMQPG
jgi:ankyrin repeat protein